MILAAGVGRRLRPYTNQHPKCMLQFGGESLLRRHLAMLASHSTESSTVVTGHLGDQVPTEVARTQSAIPIHLVRNPEYQRGSVLPLLCAASAFRSTSAISIRDADILVDWRVLERIMASPAASCLAVDNRPVNGTEEVKVVVSPAGLVVELGKRVCGSTRVIGESV